MNETPSTTDLANLMEQLARRLHSQGYASNLFPAQWAALRYIHTAEPQLRTAIDLARFQGLASGAVARTVRTLVTKGFVRKIGTIGRGRAEQLELTDQGRSILKKDPLCALAASLKFMAPAERDQLAEILTHAIRSTRSDVARIDTASS